MLHWSWTQKRATDSWPLVCERPSALRLCTGFYRPGGLCDYHCPDSSTPRGDEKVSSLIVSLSSVVSTDTGLGWRHADGQAPHLPGDHKPRAMARPPAHMSNSYASSHFCLIMNLPVVQGKVFVLFHSEQLSEVSNLPNWLFTKFCALHEWRSDELSSQRKTSKVHQQPWPWSVSPCAHQFILSARLLLYAQFDVNIKKVHQMIWMLFINHKQSKPIAFSKYPASLNCV